MQFDADLLAKLLSPLFTLIAGIFIRHYTNERSRLISFIGHISEFVLNNQERTVVRTHSIIIRNAGNKSAKNIRLAHNVLPENITVTPHVEHTIAQSGIGGEVVFPTLVPKEEITVSYLYYPPVLWSQINASLKSDEGFAKVVKALPTPQPSKFILTVVAILMLSGSLSLFYWVTIFAIKFLNV